MHPLIFKMHHKQVETCIAVTLITNKEISVFGPGFDRGIHQALEKSNAFSFH